MYFVLLVRCLVYFVVRNFYYKVHGVVCKKNTKNADFANGITHPIFLPMCTYATTSIDQSSSTILAGAAYNKVGLFGFKTCGQFYGRDINMVKAIGSTAIVTNKMYMVILVAAFAAFIPA